MYVCISMYVCILMYVCHFKLTNVICYYIMIDDIFALRKNMIRKNETQCLVALDKEVFFSGSTMAEGILCFNAITNRVFHLKSR